MNVLQQEATAKAMGMTADTMGGMLIDQEAMSKLSGIDGDNAKEKFDNLVKQVGMEEAKKRLGDDTLASQMASTSIQERFTALTEKLQEAFVGIIGPVMEIVSPLMDLVSTVLPAINFLLSPLIEGFSLIGKGVTMFVNGLKEGNPLAVTLAATMGILSFNLIKSAIAGIWTSLSQIPFGVGLALAGVATAGLISMVGKASSMKDGVIDPKKGPVVSGDFGTVQLNPKDSIVAGTNLMPDNKVRTSPSSPPQQSQSIDYDKMAQAMSRVKVQTNLDGVDVSRGLQKAPLGMATRKL
jgi:putative Mn2+ efflux pump MntP